jgi:hypothetical protein
LTFDKPTVAKHQVGDQGAKSGTRIEWTHDTTSGNSLSLIQTIVSVSALHLASILTFMGIVHRGLGDQHAS